MEVDQTGVFRQHQVLQMNKLPPWTDVMIGGWLLLSPLGERKNFYNYYDFSNPMIEI